MITKWDAEWVGGGYPLPQSWSRKMDMPQLNPGTTAVRLAFRFCVGYVAMDQNDCILMQNGQWLPVWDFRLNGFGRVIGPKDMAVADNTPMMAAWRGAMAERRLERV